MKNKLTRTAILSGFVLILCMGTALAQTVTINGTVTDSQTGNTLPGVNILVVGTSMGTVTDANGHYNLNAPSLQDTLRFSYIGYKTQTVPINGRTTINITLESSVQALNQVVVTALGIERQQESIGTSQQTVGSRKIEEAPAVGIANKLAGQTSGLKIVSSSGQPGSASRIVIRGANSITGNNQPLFVVDGVPISNASSSNPIGSPLYHGSGGSRALDIDPSIIESITVLKGGAATALYGSRATNGAILIKTKSGHNGPVRINFNSTERFDQAIIKGTQDEYLAGQHGFFSNGLPLDKGGYAAPGYPGTDPQTLYSWGPKKGEVSQQALNALGVKGIQTYNQLKSFYQTGIYAKNSINVSGGNDNETYFISGSRLDQKGIVPTTSLKRTNFNLKVTKQILPDNLVSKTNVSYINTVNDRTSNGYYSTARSIRLWPINLKMKPYLYNDGTIRTIDAITDSPFWRVNNTGFNTNVNRMILKQKLTYNIASWISVSEVFGLDRYGSKQHSYQNRRKLIANDGGVENRKRFRSLMNNYIKLDIEDINITQNFSMNAHLGNNINVQKSSSTSVSGSDQVIPGFFNESNFKNVNGSSYLSSRHKFSFYGEVEFNYGDYLFLTLTGRNDWSSTLPKDNRSYFYPSASLAFSFSDLLGLSDDSFFSYGKIRASIARTGNDAPLYSLSTNYFAPTFGGSIHEVNEGLKFPYNGVSGFIQSSTLGNPNLRPERTKSYEVGVDLRFFKSRAGIHATYYSKLTSDQIYSTPVSPSTGFSNKLRNAGEIRNRGLDITLKGTPVSTHNFNWTLQANFSKNVSSVVDLAPGVNQIYLAGFSFPSIQASVGNGYGSIIGYAYKRNKAGQLIIQDDPDDPNYGNPIELNQQTVIGNIQPDWTGNLRTSFSYKGFSLAGLFDFQRGGDILDFGLNYTIRYGMAAITENRGTQMTDPDKPGYIKPFIWKGVKASNGEPNNIKVLRNQDFWVRYSEIHENQVQTAGFIKLRQLSLSYRLPLSVLKNTPIRTASFTVTGRNLWIKTDFPTGDPEGSLYGSGNGGNGYYLFITPTSRSILFSLHLGF